MRHNAETRDLNHVAQYENIALGMPLHEVESLIGWAGRDVSGGEWPRTVGDIRALESGVERKSTLITAERGVEQQSTLIAADRELVWKLWFVEGRVQTIAVGFVRQKGELIAVAKRSARDGDFEPAR